MPNNSEKWLQLADEDCAVANLLMRQNEPFYGAVCFHAQQAAEKYLKALIIHHGRNPRKTHDLLKLCVECGILVPAFRYSAANAGELTRYAVTSRYAGAPAASRSEAERAIALMIELQTAVREHLTL